MDRFDELWKDRQELLNIEESDSPCLCDEFGSDVCPIHSTIKLEMVEKDIIDKFTKSQYVTRKKKGLRTTTKKTPKGNLGRV